MNAKQTNSKINLKEDKEALSQKKNTKEKKSDLIDEMRDILTSFGIKMSLNQPRYI